MMRQVRQPQPMNLRRYRSCIDLHGHLYGYYGLMGVLPPVAAQRGCSHKLQDGTRGQGCPRSEIFLQLAGSLPGIAECVGP